MNAMQNDLINAVETVLNKCDLFHGYDNLASVQMLVGLATNCDEEALLTGVQDCLTPTPSEDHRDVILAVLAPLIAIGLVVVHDSYEPTSLSYTFYPNKVLDCARFVRLTTA